MLRRRDPPPTRAQKLVQRQRRMRTMAASAQPRRGAVYGGSTTRAVLKTRAYRDRALLDMAQRRPCLLLVPGVCNARLDTTVAAHSNWSEHGKAGARKADDCYSCWSCSACHSWLDQGTAPGRLKRSTFMGAHARQVLAWRQVAVDPNEPQRFRRAAVRALEHLNATPLPPDGAQV